MKIQRIYSLPNCTLLIDGISLGNSDVLSILTNFEYQFYHTQERIVGGRNLLEILAKLVNQYVQSLQMMRITASEVQSNGAVVSLKPISNYLHQLHLQPTVEDAPDPKPIEIQLSTVQLFDLIDSIDQLCSDQQTLPDLQLVIAPLKDKTPSKAGVKVIPAMIGIAGVAIAAVILNFMPVPSPPPKPQLQESSQTQKPQPKAATQPKTTPQATPESKSEPASQSLTEPTSKPSVEATSTPSPLPESIKDTEQVAKLQKELEEKLDKAWTDTPKFDVILAYRVAVNAQGEIVGYKPADTLTPPEEKTLPLKQLLVTPISPETGGSPSQAQSTVEFLVTFTPGGKLTVKPSSAGSNGN